MKKKLSATLVVAFLLAISLSLTVFAANWEDKITGGGQAITSGGEIISLTISAWDDGSGNYSGQMQYSRNDGTLDMHANVECVHINSVGEIAVAAGPAKAQYDPYDFVGTTGVWMVVMIKEGGIGSGDWVRVKGETESVARSYCAVDYPGPFYGYVFDGNFNIRSK